MGLAHFKIYWSGPASVRRDEKSPAISTGEVDRLALTQSVPFAHYRDMLFLTVAFSFFFFFFILDVLLLLRRTTFFVPCVSGQQFATAELVNR